MSETEISDDRLGRMVMVLRREHFSEEEITAALRPEDWKAHAGNYRWSIWHHWWDCKKIDDAVIDWVNANNVWPSTRDYYHANRLPSWNTMHHHESATHWCRCQQDLDGSYHRWPYWKTERRATETLHQRIARRAGDLTVPMLLSIPNITARRDAIENFGGPKALIEKGGGEQVQQDDYGVLWKLNYQEPGVMDSFRLYVEVVNSTQNPDGTYDHYFLRVPPGTTSAKDGVAWTGHYETPARWRPRWEPPVPGAFTDFQGFSAQS